jgi:LGFP repeat
VATPRAPDGSSSWIHVEVNPDSGSTASFLVTSVDVIPQNNLTELPECPEGDSSNPPPLPFPVGGLIGAIWRQLGGFNALGLPTSPEYSVTGGADRRQDFVGGQIAFSPAQGPRMMVWGRQVGEEVEFGWGPTDPYNYDFFIVRWSQTPGLPTAPDRQEDIRGGPRTFGASDFDVHAKGSRLDAASSANPSLFRRRPT